MKGPEGPGRQARGASQDFSPHPAGPDRGSEIAPERTPHESKLRRDPVVQGGPRSDPRCRVGIFEDGQRITEVHSMDDTPDLGRVRV